MGFYINKNTKGVALPARGKYNALMQDEGTVNVSGDEFVPNLVCVIENTFFDAALYCFSKEEYEVAKEPDMGKQRIRTWLTHPKAAELSGYEK